MNWFSMLHETYPMGGGGGAFEEENVFGGRTYGSQKKLVNLLMVTSYSTMDAKCSFLFGHWKGYLFSFLNSG